MSEETIRVLVPKFKHLDITLRKKSHIKVAIDYDAFIENLDFAQEELLNIQAETILKLRGIKPKRNSEYTSDQWDKVLKEFYPTVSKKDIETIIYNKLYHFLVAEIIKLEDD